jgi:type VI secretion system protein ImpI
MKQLLDARGETKRLTRSTQQTMIQAQGNNPLKFSPTAEDAPRIMLGPATRGYFDAPKAFAQGFSDLNSHQLRTYSAMQKAVRIIAEDLDPAAIENATAEESGLAALIGSRKARMWDSYVTRWKAKTQRRDDGLVDVFTQYFAECYDKADSNQ